jgi:tetratricopeptide (TPR) repeat protein
VPTRRGCSGCSASTPAPTSPFPPPPAWRDNLGYAEHQLGNFGDAVGCYGRALAIFRDFGERFYEAEILTHLGDTRQVADDLQRAREAWQRALAILEDLGHSDADEFRAKLASLPPPVTE